MFSVDYKGSPKGYTLPFVTRTFNYAPRSGVRVNRPEREQPAPKGRPKKAPALRIKLIGEKGSIVRNVERAQIFEKKKQETPEIFLLWTTLHIEGFAAAGYRSLCVPQFF